MQDNDTYENKLVQDLLQQVRHWDDLLLSPYRYGGTEFRVGLFELGHVLENGSLELLFSDEIKTLLVKLGKAEPHTLYPNSGWGVYHMTSGAGVYHGVWLLKIAYLQARIRFFKQQKTYTIHQPQLRSYMQNLSLTDDLSSVLEAQLRA